MELGLQNKVVLVTGASQGIGQACALAFAREGASVVICGRDPGKVDRTIALAGEQGLTLYGRTADVTDEDSFRALLEWAWERFGRLDVLVNNAGHGSAGPALSLTREAWQDLIDTNLTAVWSCSKLAAPYLAKSGGGAIVNLSSLSGRIAFTNQGAYPVSKAGVNALTAVLASELAAEHIRVVAVAPGFTDTDMIKKHGNGERLAAMTILQRLAQPEEIAGLVTYLASDAAAYITAEVVEISGGAFRVRDPRFSWDGRDSSN